MFPDSISAVVGFLLVVAPGLILEAVREHRRPTADRSAFREASGVALASLVFGAIALAVLWGVRQARSSVLPDPVAWIQQGSKYSAAHLWAVVLFFLGWVTLASLAALFGGLLLFKESDARIDPHTTAWFELFRRQVPDGTFPIARVILEDRSEYLGEVIYYDANLITGEREVVLGPPLWHKTEAEVKFKPFPPEEGWRRVALPGARVLAVWVRYPKRRGSPPDGRRRWLRRASSQPTAPSPP